MRTGVLIIASLVLARRQRFTPRRPRSKWSQINCAAATRMHAEGRLAPAGIRAMESAKRDGRWDAAYAPPRTMAVPEDLLAALDSQNRYAILYRLHDAKRAATRQGRLEKFVRMLEAGETVHERKPKRSAGAA
jgi:uncharacterized protein YdeI (YjbR/CyaY-like superfamily)